MGWSPQTQQGPPGSLEASQPQPGILSLTPTICPVTPAPILLPPGFLLPPSMLPEAVPHVKEHSHPPPSASLNLALPLGPSLLVPQDSGGLLSSPTSFCVAFCHPHTSKAPHTSKVPSHMHLPSFWKFPSGSFTPSPAILGDKCSTWLHSCLTSSSLMTHPSTLATSPPGLPPPSTATA